MCVRLLISLQFHFIRKYRWVAIALAVISDSFENDWDNRKQPPLVAAGGVAGRSNGPLDEKPGSTQGKSSNKIDLSFCLGVATETILISRLCQFPCKLFTARLCSFFLSIFGKRFDFLIFGFFGHRTFLFSKCFNKTIINSPAAHRLAYPIFRIACFKNGLIHSRESLKV